VRVNGRKIEATAIVFIGSSITAPRPLDGVDLNETFTWLIGVARGYKQFVNTGVSSNTTTLMLARYERDVLSEYPGAVCIEPGPNDEDLSVPIATSESNIRAMVRKSQTQGTRVTLMVPILVRDPTTDAAVNAWRTLTRNLATELGCELFDVYDDFAAMSEATLDTLYLPADIYHINSAGHQFVADRALAEGVLMRPIV
jgi:lysophospholipase L1-like esterase